MRSEAVVVGSYALLTLLLTYPLIFNLTTAVPGDATDSWMFYWDLWWVKRAVLDLHTNPYFTTDVHYPYGAALYFHTLLLVPAILALPLVTTLGLTAAYNLLVLLAFTGGGYGAYRLVLYVLAQERSARATAQHVRLAAFIGGSVFTFSSFHFAHLLGHLNLVSLQWLPFFVLFLLKSWRTPGWRNPALAALFLALASLTEWSYALYLGLFATFFVAYRLVAERVAAVALKRLGRVTAGLGIYLVAIAPILVPMLVAGRADGRVPDPAGDAVRFSADLVALVLPSPLHPLWGANVAPLYEALGSTSRAESVVFLGYVPLLLLLGGLGSIWARQRFWLVAFALFTVLALGPVLHVAGRTVSITAEPLALPYQLLQQLPYVDIARVPSRLTVMSTLCLAVLAGHVAVALLRRVHSARKLAAVVSLLLGGILFEQLATPYPMAAVSIPPVYTQLARDARPTAVLEVPVGDDAGALQRMLYQTAHLHPIYGGSLARGRAPLPYDALPGFAQFNSLTLSGSDIVEYDAEALPAIGQAVLAAHDLGYVVIDKRLLGPADVERARAVAVRLLGGAEPWHEDALTLTFAAPASPASAPAFVHLDQGWYELERAPSTAPPGGPAQWRWMAQEAQLRLVGLQHGEYRLTLDAWAVREPTRVAVLLNDVPVATLEVSPEHARYEVPLTTTETGTQVLRLRSLVRARVPDGPDRRPLSIAVSHIRLDPERGSTQQPPASRGTPNP